MNYVFHSDKEAIEIIRTLMSLLQYSEEDKLAFSQKLKEKGAESAFARVL